ncbi:hypothetical protein [Halococcus sediminicola]|uniref:hypothetical protein n=1 Tax=Halococcus sediminicola TaxID=1264579 RepID=UPI000679BF32|nr:hypothetical protein [Halococcus sediminicola]
MAYEKEAARCVECESVTTAKVDGDEDQFLMGVTECPDCGCEDFDILEMDESEDQPEAADD